MSKHIIVSLLFLITAGVVKGQDDINPPLPDFKYSFSKTEVKVGDEVELVVNFTVPEGCHAYSKSIKCEFGPTVFEFDFKPNSSFKKSGSPVYKGDHFKFDNTYGCEVGEFHSKSKAEIRQKIKILSEKLDLKGEVLGQICSDKTGTCYMFYMVNNNKPVTLTQPALKILPADEGTVIDTTTATPTDTAKTTGIKPENKTTDSTSVKAGADNNDIEDKGLWALFILGISGGLLALLTPCVFPMIPMTVAYFTKQENKRKGRKMAIFYGISIVVIFLIIGLLFSAIFGKSFGHQLSSHWFPNLLFFTIFLVFGFSFLGAFELTLPNNMVNKIDQKGDKGGYLGVFFIALTLVVVSFSCTVPIVGQIAILASNQELIRPFFALLGFSLTFAIPFTVFAFFPQWLKGLPKSGGWLNVIKVVLGFVELALALKFFSNADLSYHWGILNRDIFLAAWIAISLFCSFYLLGWFKTHNDSEVKYLSVGRLLFAVFFFGFGVYMIPGLFGAPLKPLSGLLPPPQTQEFNLLSINGSAHEDAGTDKYNQIVKGETIKYSEISNIEIPLEMKGYFDLEQAKKAAIALKKPLFVDFTGHNCANCRLMENNVWSKPEILELLRAEFVKVSLYIDEQTSLPKEEQYTSKDGNEIETIGEKNGDIQYNLFGSQGQPYYYILNGEGKVISVYHGYNPDANKFMAFLKEGLSKYKP